MKKEEAIRMNERYLTNYEQENGINITKTETTNFKDVSIIKKFKSDGDIGLTIVFNASINPDKENWLIWCPSENQLDFLKVVLPDIIEEVNIHNEKNKKIDPATIQDKRMGITI